MLISLSAKNAIKNETENVNKNSLFGTIFDLLTSRTQKIAWCPLFFKPDLYIFYFNEQLGKI